MIADDIEYQASINYVARLQAMLLSIRGSEIDADNFRASSGSYLVEVRKVHHEIEEYLSHPVCGNDSKRIDPVLPDWCNVYAGMTEAEIDDVDAAIVRSHAARDIDRS